MDKIIRHHEDLSKLEMLQIQWLEQLNDKQRAEKTMAEIEAKIAVEKMKNNEAA